MSLSSFSKRGDPLHQDDANASPHENAVGHLYDRLLQAETAKIDQQNLTIHKRLRFPKAEQERGIFDSNDWLKANLVLPDNAHILDAGCGVGGTLFALLGEGNTAVGITLSQTQVAVAQQVATQLNTASRCRFRQQSYDEPLGETFDLIIVIEALIHSPNLAASIQNLAAHLKPGGQLVILEDMAQMTLSNHPLSKILKQAYCLQALCTKHDYVNAVVENGLMILQESDFTPYIQTVPWPRWFIQLSWALIDRLPVDIRGSKDIFVGGWALEKMYRLKLLSYQLLVAQKL